MVSAMIDILDSDDPDCRSDEDGDEDDMNFITGISPHWNASSSCCCHLILNSSKLSPESQSQGLNTNIAKLEWSLCVCICICIYIFFVNRNHFIIHS